jgi:hypothetical protein
MSAPITPEDGDVVIEQEQRDGQQVYVLRTFPGRDQYLLRSRQEAVAKAVAFAKRQHVRAWFSDSRDSFTLVESSRPSERARPFDAARQDTEVNHDHSGSSLESVGGTRDRRPQRYPPARI